MKKNDFMSDVTKNLKDRLKMCKDKTENGKTLGDPKNGFIKTEISPDFGKLHAEAKTPRPLGIDEVAASFVAALRVCSWESLGEEFGGYKQGRILAYILDVLNEKIEESTAATIRVDVPLYEQCPIIGSKYYGKTIKELIGDLAEKIEHSCDSWRKTEEKQCQ